MLIIAAVIAMDPLAYRRHCSPSDGAVARNATDPSANFPISLGVATLHDGSGTKPETMQIHID